MFDPATLQYDQNGLIPAIAQDAASGEVLMMAWMNAESVARARIPEPARLDHAELAGHAGCY